MTGNNTGINSFAIEIAEWHHIHAHVPPTDEIIQFQHGASTMPREREKYANHVQLETNLRRSIVPINFNDECPLVNKRSSRARMVSKSTWEVFV